MNQESRIKNQGRKTIIHNSLFAILSLLVLGLLFLYFMRTRPVKSQPSAPIVRDEFIEKLVNEAQDVFPLMVQGRTYYEQGELVKAQKLFKKATQLDSFYRDSYYHLGLAEQALGSTRPALYAFLRAKTLDPLYKPAYERLAEVYNQLGEADKAKEIKERLDNI